MEKKHLFRVIVLIGSLPWLHLLEVGVGFKWVMWFIVIQVLANLAYYLCKDDEKDNQSYFDN
jgi:hypothetical protein